MWGVKVGDEDTIPSRLSMTLAQRGYEVDVTNFGQQGYVTTQEIITLFLELRRGNRPDLVVFYDGVNDVGASTQRAIAGETVNERNRELEFQSVTDSTLGVSTANFVRSLAISRRVRTLLQLDERAIAKVWQTRAMPQTGGEVLHDYNFNMKIVEMLAEHFNFETVYYWQPTVFQKDALVSYEAEIVADSPTTGDYYELIYQAVCGMREEPDDRFDFVSTCPDFHYLGDVFDTDEWGSKQAFTDFCHLNAEANAYIAKRMADDLAEKIDRLDERK